MKLFYEEFGSVEHPALIILHGFFASSRNWRQVAKDLAQNYHVYVLDLRNHGLSAHSEHMDYAVMAVDLYEFMQQAKLQQASLLGHSMGGKVAMWFALQWPQQVDKLVVVDIAPVNYSHSFDALIAALKSLPLQQIKNRKQAEELLQDAIPELSFRQFLLQNLIIQDGEYCWRIDLEIFANTASNITAFPDIQQIPAYPESCLFMLGGKSTHVKTEHEETIYTLFPRCKIEVLSEAGHWLHAEQPQQFLTTLKTYL